MLRRAVYRASYIRVFICTPRHGGLAVVRRLAVFVFYHIFSRSVRCFPHGGFVLV